MIRRVVCTHALKARFYICTFMCAFIQLYLICSAQTYTYAQMGVQNNDNILYYIHVRFYFNMKYPHVKRCTVNGFSKVFDIVYVCIVYMTHTRV